jgi:predicted TIM-barrel fold metal-dependent hydrolase
MSLESEVTLLISGRIDTHIHIVPPKYGEYLDAHGIKATGGATELPDWSPQAALRFMDEHAIAVGILSVSSPGVHFGTVAKIRQVARAVNEVTAEVTQKWPDRFGFFATLTLPDVEGAIAEANYAFDVLHAEGVILLANVGGRYLGDPEFDPLMEELNRRSATIFVHPSDLPSPDIPGIPGFAADFLLDTTRAAIALAHSGAMTRFPNLKIILAHAGGFVPYAAYRFAPLCSEDNSTDTGIATLKRFYFDVALSSTPSALPSLVAFAEPNHITYGSDWPWAPIPIIDRFVSQLEQYPLSPKQRSSLERGAADLLFPHFASGEQRK